MRGLRNWRAISAWLFCILAATHALTPAGAQNPTAEEIQIVSETNLALMAIYTEGVEISVAMSELQGVLDEWAEGLEPEMSVEEVLDALNLAQEQIALYDVTGVEAIELPELSNEIFAASLKATTEMVRNLPVLLNRQAADLRKYAYAILAADETLILALQDLALDISIALLESENVVLSQMIGIGQNHPQRGLQRLMINSNGFAILLLEMAKSVDRDASAYDVFLDRISELDTESKHAMKDGERHVLAWRTQLLTMPHLTERQLADRALLESLAGNYARAFKTEAEIALLLTDTERLIAGIMNGNLDQQAVREAIDNINVGLEGDIQRRLELYGERQVIIGEYAIAIQALAE